VFIVQLLLV